MNRHSLKKICCGALLAILLLAPSAETLPKARRSGSARAAVKLDVNRQANDQRRVELFVRTELFFGSAKPDGAEVTEEEWRQFLDREITPRFPDGLTVLTGAGQFRNAAGVIVRETSRLLILLYPLSSQRNSHEKIEQIREAYQRAFQQQSVLRVDQPLPVRVSF
jgi:hypothetical protein